MRVLYIITGLATGGAETMLLKLLERLDRTRYEPLVISLTTEGDIGPRITALDITVKTLGITSGLRGVCAFPRLVKEIRLFRPDVVHTWLYHADLLGGMAARLAGVPAVCWGIRSSNLDADKTHWSTRAIRRLCALLSHVIPQRIFLNSGTARQIHLSLGYAAKKMFVLPNGFDLDRFKPDENARFRVRVGLGCAENALLVGMVGRFDPLKNHAGFIEAMAIVHRHMPQVHFVLAGKGIDAHNEELMASIRRENLTENMHLLGSRNDVPDLMAAFDVLVCPSHAEAFPNVVGEAMASGVPCVVTDVGDCAYIIGDTGYVVPKGDMGGLTKAVEAILGLPCTARTAMGERARVRVSRLFEINKVVRQYEESYESLKVGVQ